MVRFDHVS